MIGGGLAEAMPDTKAIGWLFVVIGIVILLWGVRINDLHLWQPWWRTAPAELPEPSDMEPISEHTQVDSIEWQPTEAEIREECAAHGWPRAEPYLSEARDHLIMEREFNRIAADKGGM